MSFKLPPAGTATREAMGDLQHAVMLLDPKNLSLLPTLTEAITIGKRQLSQCRANGAVAARICIICIAGNDDRLLISVGNKGGWKKLWNFGNGRN